MADNARNDINGDAKINSLDVSWINGHYDSPYVQPPTGHDICEPEP